MDKEWPHELVLTCLGHQVTIVRLGEQVTHARPAVVLRKAMLGRCMVVADWQLAAAGSRLQQAAGCSRQQAAAGSRLSGCQAEVECFLAAHKQQELAAWHGVAGQQKPAPAI